MAGKLSWIIVIVSVVGFSSFVFGKKNNTLDTSDEDDESEDLIITMRNDPSDVSSERDPISKVSQIIRLGFSGNGECPHSCFCEVEDSYASCIGDGQWNPPLIPSSLTRLEFRSFYLPELETSSVRLQGMKELQLQQCNLSKLHQDAFSEVPELDRLDLSRNHLEFLGPNQLRGLSSLKHLDLSSNFLKKLNRPFTFLTELEHLNLRNNKLEKLDAETFDGLDKVQYVNLDGNTISSVSVASFQHLGSLAHLILSNNPLSNLARLNFFGSRLQYIDVSNIGIEKVPQALTQFVRDLRLAKNNVKEIHRGDLDSYPYLGLLVLDDNGLEILEEDALGRHEYLARLWLNGNKLKLIPQSLPISLKALYIEENMITNLTDGDFSGLSNLEQIFMQRNQISIISKCAFCDLINLKTLDLQANNITNISISIFEKLGKLETLDLSQNPIMSLNSDSFKGLSYVRVLQISRVHTNITITENLLDPLKSLQILEMYGSPSLVEAVINSTRLLHSLRGVRELNLMHNEVSYLRRDFFSFFPKLNLIKFSGNSWDCSRKENIYWLKMLMQNSPINFYRSFSVRCSNPASLGFKPILLLDDDDFSDDSTTSPIFSFTISPLKESTTSLISSIYNISNLLETDIRNISTLTLNLSHSNIHKRVVSSSAPINNDEIVPTADSSMLNITESNMIPIVTPESYIMEDDNLYEEIVDFADVSKDVSSTTKPKITLQTPQAKTFYNISKSNTSKDKPNKVKSDLTITGHTSTMKTPYWSIYNRRPEKDNNKKRTLFTFSAKVEQKQNQLHNQTNNHSQIQDKNGNLPEYERDLWLYRGDVSHSYVQHRKGVSVHSLHNKSNALIIGAGIVSACIGIAFIFGGFILAKGISKKKRRLNVWENSTSSYWNWREGEEGEYTSEGVVVGIGETGTGIMRETEGTVGVVTESHHGLNNRLYLLLQRDSSTGITPDTLPDPTVNTSPNIISSERLNNDSNYFK